MNVTKYAGLNPADCENGAEILAYAKQRGLANPRLVRDFPYGLFLVGDGPDGSLPSVIASELQVSRGGGSSNWHQIDPGNYSDPYVRADDMLSAAEEYIADPAIRNSRQWNLVLSEAGAVTTLNGFVIRPADPRSAEISVQVYARLNDAVDEMAGERPTPA